MQMRKWGPPVLILTPVGGWRPPESMQTRKRLPPVLILIPVGGWRSVCARPRTSPPVSIPGGAWRSARARPRTRKKRRRRRMERERERDTEGREGKMGRGRTSVGGWGCTVSLASRRTSVSSTPR